MKFVPMLELMNKAKAGGYAVPAFACWNAESMSIVLRTAEEMASPVILMGAWVDLDEIPPEEYGRLACAVAEGYDVPAALLLDHGDTPERVERCINSGFTSIMLDYSGRPYAENVAALKAVVKQAKLRGITVEGELGAVGRVGDVTPEGSGHSALTDPAEAKRFIEETGIDVLAVAIGNAHGHYTTLPRLDFDRLEKIYRATGVPLVLHGGSGTPEPDLKKAIACGICKVNIASELITAYRESLMRQWNNRQNLWIPTACGHAGKEMSEVLRKWMRILNSEGKA